MAFNIAALLVFLQHETPMWHFSAFLAFGLVLSVAKLLLTVATDKATIIINVIFLMVSWVLL